MRPSIPAQADPGDSDYRARRAGTRPRPLPATGPNQVWAYDFVFDACANGPEFVSRALLRWSHAADIDTAAIEPGESWQNGSNVSFNGKFRDKCLTMEWFRNRIEAKVVIESWRHEYNTVRPHSSLGYQPPFEFKKSLTTTQPDGAIFQI